MTDLSPQGAPSLTKADLVSDRALRSGDPDRFNHEAIALRVADLVAEAETPVNVALFGPWGSGKSSIFELLRRALDSREPAVALVRYDAWKYGGQSLQRNFISHVATELGFSGASDDATTRRFHQGLYERRRAVFLDFARLRHVARVLATWIAITFTIAVVVSSLLIGIASLLTKESFLGQIAQTLPGLLTASAILSPIVATAKAILDGASIEVEEGEPTADEQFTNRFHELLGAARHQGRYHRFVFFIDELDRCSSGDVVQTLTAVKTFLDQPDCVFIVAADREVLERALTELPQPTPVGTGSLLQRCKRVHRQGLPAPSGAAAAPSGQLNAVRPRPCRGPRGSVGGTRDER